ncbi:hypothetical protein GXM_08951 [Nostoc sphaeroides CCNUC1]|uniref:Uncharacterized protein n=1 Tax=Nostoc sphaeroides CCNUC1 TaxID=2653204 RepID=A0A5P8WF48_9NOSO|nr:hypothetical protein GXM_08951 [Nostoc sphaeroides CCNUC1]
MGQVARSQNFGHLSQIEHCLSPNGMLENVKPAQGRMLGVGENQEN